MLERIKRKLIYAAAQNSHVHCPVQTRQKSADTQNLFSLVADVPAWKAWGDLCGTMLQSAAVPSTKHTGREKGKLIKSDS